jgi:hypothetical protein
VTRDAGMQAEAGADPRVEDLFGQLQDVADAGLTETGNTIFLELGYNWQP